MRKKIYLIVFIFGCVLNLIFFNKIIFKPLTYFQRDIILQFKPWKVLTKNFLLNLKSQSVNYLEVIPLWNHYNYCGYPFLANLQSQVFYPFSLIFYLLEDFVAAYKIFIILHFLLAFIFMFLFLRKKRISLTASIFGSIIWSFNGYMVSRIEFLSVFATMIWLPLIILLFDEIKTIKMYKIIILSYVVAIQFLAGHAQIWVYSVLFLIFYAIYKCFERKTTTPILVLTISLTFSLLLASIQIIPTAEFFFYSVRAGEDIKNIGLKYEEARLGALNFKDLLNLIYPFSWQFNFKNLYSNLILEISNYWWYTFYCGVVAIALVILGVLFHKDLKEKIFLILVAIIILSYSLGDNFFIFRILYKVFPFIRIFRYPATSMYVILFIICILGSYGLQFLEIKLKKYKKFLSLLAIITFFELYFYNNKISMLLPNSILEEKKEVINFMIEKNNLDIHKYRFMLTPLTQKLAGISYAEDLYNAIANYKDKLLGNVNIEYKLFNFQGQDIELKNYNKFKNFIYSRKSLDDTVAFLSIANIKYVLSSLEQKTNYFKLAYNFKHMKIYENPFVLPVIYPVENIIFESNLGKSLKLMEEINWKIFNTAIVHNYDFEIKKMLSNNQKSKNIDLEKINYLNNKIIIEIISDSPKFFVLSKNFYPGWKCKVNNKETKIYHTNIFMSGIILSAGKNKIIFIYEPLSFKIGTILSLFSVFLSIILLFERI